VAALQRSIPITRMVDYGVPLGDALRVHEFTSTDAPESWDDVCEAQARRHTTLAEGALRTRCTRTASQAWRAASALLQCAQLNFNADLPRKKTLYDLAAQAMAQHAALSTDLTACVVPTPSGNLHGWIVHPPKAVLAAVVVVGGLSGWGISYLNMGRALASRGILAVLAEGPGQGLSRLREGVYLNERTLPLFSKFLNAAGASSASRFGVWGNSFGGLLAAQLAARDPRVRAVCINGAPMTTSVPTFRTAREQMEALFGTREEQELTDRLGMLSMDPQRQQFAASTLIVQGGRDVLVPLGEQLGFFALSTAEEKSVLTWDDGEHTIYNHADERNSRIADWFAAQLDASAV